MNRIFVVLECSSDYESSSTQPILVTPSLEVAEKLVADMKVRLAVRNAAQDDINKHMAAHDVINPRPNVDDFCVRKDWIWARYEEIQSFTATFPQQVQDDLRNLMKEQFWEIEEVPYAE
jgi:hypothetical protein